jgi:hypothetical protein
VKGARPTTKGLPRWSSSYPLRGRTVIEFKTLAVKMSKGVLKERAGAMICRNTVLSKVVFIIAFLICVGAESLSMSGVL